jgi:hypothetical protein
MLIDTKASTYRIGDLAKITGLTKMGLWKSLQDDTEVFEPYQRVGPCFLMTDEKVEEMRRAGYLVRQYRVPLKHAVRMVRDGWTPPQSDSETDNESES